jgi:hypothetical protein
MDSENTERFTEAVKASEVFNNMTLDDYKNSKVTNKKWDEIGSILPYRQNFHSLPSPFPSPYMRR